MIKAKSWKGNALTGVWEFSYKVDGVRMLRDDMGNPVSRAGKPLHNLEHVPLFLKDCEIFMKDWNTSVSLVRTQTYKEVPLDCVYSLDPLDPRLKIGIYHAPTVADISFMLEKAVEQGYEGLVLRQNNTWLRVKPKETYDVEVLEILGGTGKNEGKVGALLTKKGKVGVGFTDQQREEFLSMEIGTVIEVECMSLTDKGKFRHPRFLRVRFDKEDTDV